MPDVEAFLHYCLHDRNRSPNTIQRYRIVLASLAVVDDPLTIDTTDLEAWWQTRILLTDGTPRAHSSRANELACLRSFFKWATRFDHRPDDPTRRLDFPNVDNHVPRPIGETDLTRLLGPLTADTPDLRRAVALGAYAGLRVSEAAALAWSDIDQESRRIYVRGKGRKERVLGLSPLLLDKLLPDTGGNVVTAGGRTYRPDTLQRRVNRLMESNGIDRTYHDLRKRAATLVMSRVRNPIAAAQAFGWSSVQTAQSYAVVGDEVLDEIAAAMV